MPFWTKPFWAWAYIFARFVPKRISAAGGIIFCAEIIFQPKSAPPPNICFSPNYPPN